METSHAFGKSHKGFQLTDCSTISGLAFRVVILAHFFVFTFQDFGGLSSEHRFLSATKLDVGLELLLSEMLPHCLITETVHLDDVSCNTLIFLVVFLVQNNEKQIEARHNGRGDINILL
jgi:hypothetical protein